MNAETIFPMLASLCGLIAFVIVVVGVIRYINSRTARIAPLVRPANPEPARRSAAGPPVLPRFLAGCGLVTLVLLGLVVFGFGVPAWLKAHPVLPAWITSFNNYISPIWALALYVVLLVALVGLYGSLRRRVCAGGSEARREDLVRISMLL
jgi:hypothetical protein